MTTNSSGNYSINLNPGTYTVCEKITDHTGWVQSYPGGRHDGQHTLPQHPWRRRTRGSGWSVTVVSLGTVSLRDFGNTPLSEINVDFLPQAKLPDGTTDATRATSITCVPGGGNTGSNTFTTSNVRISQGPIVCTITFVDP